MNPRQRRGVLLIGLAVIAAGGVFWMVSRYLADVRTQLGPMVSVVAVADDLPPFATPSSDDLVLAEVPRRWLPPNSFTDPAEIGNRVTAAAVPAGTVLSQGMFLDRPAIGPGEREIAIMVDAETGVGGKITSGAVVDIFATFVGDDSTAPSSRIVVQRAEIIEVGSPVDTPEGTAGPGSVGFGSSQSLPVTFRLSIEDARTLTYVESFAASIRLALRAPTDDEILSSDDTVYQPRLEELGRQSNPVPRGNTDPADVPTSVETPTDTDEQADEDPEPTDTEPADDQTDGADPEAVE